MKENLQEKLELLSDAKSPYFCGSSTLLSLYTIICEIENNTLKFKETFPELKENILCLFDEDPRLFELSKKKETFFDEEWEEVINILYDYSTWIEDMTELIIFCKESRKQRYVKKLHMDLQFIVGILKETLTIFENREDIPPEYARAENDVLFNIKRGAAL